MVKETTAQVQFGAKVKRLRKRAGLTQEQLAERTGYTRQAISLIESAGTGVSGPGRMALAAALGVRSLD